MLNVFSLQQMPRDLGLVFFFPVHVASLSDFLNYLLLADGKGKFGMRGDCWRRGIMGSGNFVRENKKDTAFLAVSFRL